MESSGAKESMKSGSSAALCSEATIEIKIKTLDSYTYTMRVDKCVPVPALKDQIATITGILSEEQRLICRGKVLKDDELLSAYHVEDGHTLHLVVRQPIPPASEGLPGNPATDSMSSADHSQSTSVLVGTFTVPEQGNGAGALPDFGRIVSAFLSSFGGTNGGSGHEGVDVLVPGLQRLSQAGVHGGSRSSSRQQSNHAASVPNDLSTPPAFSANPLQSPVIPDSLTTLFQYLSHLRQELSTNAGNQSIPSRAANNNSSDGQSSSGASGSAPSHGAGGLPTPASLAGLIRSTRQFLNDQVGDCLLQLARQIEDHTRITNPVDRSGIQSNALRVGSILQNLGALLLELGRATMTLRIGQTPAEAVVNAGPAVFISGSGPNPIMVQPLPFQPGASFGTVPLGSGNLEYGVSSGSMSSGFLSRNFDMRIRTGSVIPSSGLSPRESTVGQSTGQTNHVGSGTENSIPRPTSAVNQSSSTSRHPEFRVTPRRTVIGRIPATVGRAPTTGSTGLFYPVLASVHHSENANSSRGQLSDQPPHAANTFQHSTPTVNAPRVDEIHGSPDHDRLGQFFGNMVANEQFPDITFHGMGMTPVNGNVEAAQASNSQETAPRVSDDGIFLSNLLRQVMPIVSQNVQETNISSADEVVEYRNAGVSSVNADEDRSNRGTSRWRDDPSPPESSKRQKTE